MAGAAASKKTVTVKKRPAARVKCEAATGGEAAAEDAEAGIACDSSSACAVAADDDETQELGGGEGANGFDLALMAGPSAGSLPSPLRGCFYDAAGKNWIPKQRFMQVPADQRLSLLRGYSHQVEKARSGQSSCKRCGTKIPKGELRVGYPVKDHRGEYGAIPFWLHASCAQAEPTFAKYFRVKGGNLGQRLVGFDALSADEQQQLRTEVLRDHSADDEEVRLPAVPATRCLVQHERPASLKVGMLPFQAEGLSWLLEREADRTTKGGILADEMGMGKTLQMISLLLASKTTGPNLVVCPAAAMLQWRNEITRFVEPGVLGVELYYGQDRKGLDFNDRGNIVVLTTYQTLEADYRHEVNRYKVACPYCNRHYLPEKLPFHLKYFCGPDAERTEKQQKAQRRRELKEEVEKRMKIGGVETEITLMNALRGNGAAILQTNRRRKREKGAEESPTSKELTPPVKMATPETKSSCKTTAFQAKLQRTSSWGSALRSFGSSDAIALDEDQDVEEEDLDSDVELILEGADGSPQRGGPPVGVSDDQKVLDNDESARMGSVTTTTSAVRKGKVEEVFGELPPDPGSESDEDLEGRDLSASALFRTRWNRVILDEAHRIKGRVNSTAQASFRLKATTSRWCMSGTPLQNRVGEVYSMIRFLRFYPYGHYLCTKKGCDCASLHYRFDVHTSLCKKCGHSKMMHRSFFATTISNPVKNFGFVGAGKAAIERLRSDILDRILLRRTKAERHEDLQLPPIDIRIRRDHLSPEESDFYKAMFQNSLTQFDTYVDKGTVLHNYAHIFDLIMRLRQAVDHPYLIVHGSLRTDKGPIPTKSRSEVGLGVCSLCQDDFDDLSTRVVAQCGHPFHRECVADYLQQAPELPSGGVGCPACFSPLTVSLEEAGGEIADGSSELPTLRSSKTQSIMQRIKAAEFKSSTKIEALLQELDRMCAADSTSKALVFSQFVTFLELIEWRLKHKGISCAKLLGSMSVVSKNNMIISFQTDPSLKVLLISLKAGGEGLNLQAADHIFLMDPWWNPASELQAIQRAHRIGQVRPVHAIRFVAKDTIEEKIIQLQEKKQAVFDCSVGNSNQALQRLTSEDLSFLFCH